MDGKRIIAWNVRRLRVARAVSQERLAFDARIDRAYVGLIERGAANPTIDILERIAVVLEAPLAALFQPIDSATAHPPALRPGRRAKTQQDPGA